MASRFDQAGVFVVEDPESLFRENVGALRTLAHTAKRRLAFAKSEGPGPPGDRAPWCCSPLTNTGVVAVRRSAMAAKVLSLWLRYGRQHPHLWQSGQKDGVLNEQQALDELVVASVRGQHTRTIAVGVVVLPQRWGGFGLNTFARMRFNGRAYDYQDGDARAGGGDLLVHCSGLNAADRRRCLGAAAAQQPPG